MCVCVCVCVCVAVEGSRYKKRSGVNNWIYSQKFRSSERGSILRVNSRVDWTMCENEICSGLLTSYWAPKVSLLLKDPPADAGDVRGLGCIPGLQSSPGAGHGNPPQYSCLENPMHRGAWRATVHRVTEQFY